MKMKATNQNLWDTMKASLSGTFAALTAYIGKLERSQTTSLVILPKALEK